MARPWRALVRRWYVVLAGLLCTALALAITVHADDAVYYSEVDVVFYPPNDPTVPGNVLEGQQISLIYFAASIERQFNDGKVSPRLSSASATLYGAGVRRGYSVVLPNTGGQWTTSFGRPVLAVEVVDTTAERVQTQMQTLLAKINGLVTTRQDEMNVAQDKRITTDTSPTVPVIARVTGSRMRAVAGIGVLGVGLSVSAAVLADLVLTRRARRRRGRLSAVGSGPGRADGVLDRAEERAGPGVPAVERDELGATLAEARR